jgi:UDP-N-acetylglucosamine acyltransferase
MSKSNNLEELIHPTANIHPTAIVEIGAQIGAYVVIEPYVIVKSNVILENNVTIKAHVYLDGHTTVGSGTTIYPFASIGTKTQDKKFKGEKTFVKIGKNCDIRENVTINSSCEENSVVSVGDNCLLMAYCHVAHNCEVGNGVILANAVNLAGHVIVEEGATLGGMLAVHQFTRIGAHSMVGGFSRVTHDILPYTIGAGSPYKVGGLNMVGLKRKGFSYQTRKDLASAFKLIYRSELRFAEAVDRIEKEIEPSIHIKHIIQFCRNSHRGLIGLQGISSAQQSPEESAEYERMIEEDAK